MRSFDAEPVEVRLDGCYCPGTPHEVDLVYLAPQLPMAGGMAAQSAINDGLDDSLLLQALLAEVWVRFGVVGWNLLDDVGADVPLNAANIKAALPFGKGGALVAERADELYAQDILAPLVARLPSTSRRGLTNGSTSRQGPTRTRKPSSRSSTVTTAKAPPAA